MTDKFRHEWRTKIEDFGIPLREGMELDDIGSLEDRKAQREEYNAEQQRKKIEQEKKREENRKAAEEKKRLKELEEAKAKGDTLPDADENNDDVAKEAEAKK